MTERIQELTRRRIAFDVLATVIGAVSAVVFVLLGERWALLLGSYSLLLGTSTAVVTYSLTQFTGITIRGTDHGEEAHGRDEDGTESLHETFWRTFTGEALESDSDLEEDTGWLIGRLENILVLTLVLTGEYTALSIIFAAKSWVRIEDTASENSTYYLAGTLVNFTYSIAIGVGVVWLLDLV